MLSIISQATDQLTAQGLERHIDRSNQVLEEYLGALNRPSKIEDVHPFWSSPDLESCPAVAAE